LVNVASHDLKAEHEFAVRPSARTLANVVDERPMSHRILRMPRAYLIPEASEWRGGILPP
jgi:hypothetical protein